MKRRRLTEEQAVRILAQADKGEQPIIAICRKDGVSQATFDSWRKRFWGMGVDEVGECRQPKKENARLKKLLAD